MFLNIQEAAVHTLTVALSFVILAISLDAFRKRGGRRYSFLAIGFMFLSISELIQFVESYTLDEFILVPYIEIHLSHIFDLAMLASFAAALLSK